MLPSTGSQEEVRRYLLQRLLSRLNHALEQRPFDLDYLHFVCSQDMVFFSATHLQIPQEIISALQDLHVSIQTEIEDQHPLQPTLYIQNTPGPGRPEIQIPMDMLVQLLEMGLPVTDISTLLGISAKTIYRKLSEHGVTARGLYSQLSDAELDTIVSAIKDDMPHAGYRLVKATLQGRGHRVQYHRVRSAMHRVDTAGVLCRLGQMGCVVRRKYFVPCPKSLVHIDTNHKLIR
ncbi:hypothetical protein UPYG_G00025980 [Umbra pygmaea]|uniref:Uncharacterized protein n=1 Tax=Umbra pygmaea TaxID=75934 RepID=A0ABD0XLW3_UMBPY